MNTQTGQQSRDLPTEGDDGEDAEVAALSPQGPSRVGPETALSLASTSVSSQEGAGFGIPRRTRTPEPWVRRLADDGLSYYYLNTLDGSISWTLPEPAPITSNAPPSYNDEMLARDAPSRGPSAASNIPRNGSANGIASMGRLRSESSVSRTRERSDSSVDRFSIHSDDSEVYPSRRDLTDSATGTRKLANGRPPAALNASTSRSNQSAPGLELTAAEESAKMLQDTLASSAVVLTGGKTQFRKRISWRSAVPQMKSVQSSPADDCTRLKVMVWME